MRTWPLAQVDHLGASLHTPAWQSSMGNSTRRPPSYNRSRYPGCETQMDELPMLQNSYSVAVARTPGRATDYTEQLQLEQQANYSW